MTATKVINFDRKYKKKILKGEKVTTIRLGKRKFSEGQEVVLSVEDKPFAKATVKRVEYKKLSELSEEDAKKDGFHSKKKLLKVLKQYYPKIREDSEITVIEFENVEPLKKEE